MKAAALYHFLTASARSSKKLLNCARKYKHMHQKTHLFS